MENDSNQSYRFVLVSNYTPSTNTNMNDDCYVRLYLLHSIVYTTTQYRRQTSHTHSIATVFVFEREKQIVQHNCVMRSHRRIWKEGDGGEADFQTSERD